MYSMWQQNSIRETSALVCMATTHTHILGKVQQSLHIAHPTAKPQPLQTHVSKCVRSCLFPQGIILAR